MRIAATLITILINVAASAQSVGDIPFDPATDNPNFTMCLESWVWQGYQLKTPMDETAKAVSKELTSKYTYRDEWKNETGLIRVRFLVNCHGMSDRFRALGLDSDIKEKELSKSLTAHVIQLAKEFAWPVRRSQSSNKDAQTQTVDYYHFIVFNIKDGKLIEIVQ